MVNDMGQWLPELPAGLPNDDRYATASLVHSAAVRLLRAARAADAERVAARVPDTWRAYVARGLDRSPLLDELDSWGVAKR